MLTVTPSEAALGATITGIDLRRLDDVLVAALRRALLRYEVLFFPGAALTPEEQVHLGRAFGVLERHAALDSYPGVPEMVVFDTDARAPTAEWWHTDVTCAPEPPMGAILQMVIAPQRGGATHWASMTAAYDALDDSTKTRIESLRAVHESWWEPCQRAVHPVVRMHPENGRRALFVNGIFTKRIVGLDPAESDELMQTLLSHATSDRFTVQHEWTRGDIAFWDNRCTQHRVDNDFASERRLAHRIAITGDIPR